MNDWTDWAQDKGYINSWDNHSIVVLLCPFIDALFYNRKDEMETKTYVSFVTMYAIASVYRQLALDYRKQGRSENKHKLIREALYAHNFWLCSEGYTKLISPIEGMFNLLFALNEDEQKLIEFWNDRKEEIQQKGTYSDLKIQIERWKTGKQLPTWKMIKLFLNEDLCPDNSMIKNPFPDEFSTKEIYLAFRRKLFSACFITRFFHFLLKQEIMDEETKEMIHRGIFLFYKHFEESLLFGQYSKEEAGNPMYRMMEHFLIYEDMGLYFTNAGFNADADFYSHGGFNTPPHGAYIKEAK